MVQIIEFLATDGAILNGFLNKSKEKTNKVLIEIHGMTSNCFQLREKIIADEIQKNKIDTICFNTRGSEIIKYQKYQDGRKILAGTAYENIDDSYYDIVGAIKYAINLGYTSIYLQGHSLGATKVVYVYNKIQKENKSLLKNIKALILLSLVDIPDMFKSYAGGEILKYAEKKEKEDRNLELMPAEGFIHLISVKTFLKYIKYNENINFAQYSNKNDDFKILNNINVPLFMRWGENNELIKMKSKDQVEFMNMKIKNNNKDINLIKGANHSYSGKEKELAMQISAFLNEIMVER